MPSDRRCGTCRWWDERKELGRQLKWGDCNWPRPFWIVPKSDRDVLWEENGTTCPTWEARDADAE